MLEEVPSSTGEGRRGKGNTARAAPAVLRRLFPARFSRVDRAARGWQRWRRARDEASVRGPAIRLQTGDFFMDLQLFIALNVLTISALIIVATIEYRPRGAEGWLVPHGSWLAVNAAVVAIGGLALWFVPEWAGYIVLALFVPLVAAPVALFNLSQRQAQAGRATLAARLAYCGALLHPTTANWMNAHLQGALAKSDPTNTKPLDDLAASAPPQYRGIIAAHAAFTRRDWSEVLAFAEPDGPADLLMKPLEIRALGETGQTDAMVRCYRRVAPKLVGATGNMPKLAVLAFGGRPDAVARLVEDKMPGLGAEVKTYWTGVACLNMADNPAAGQRMLQQLAAGASSLLTRAAAQRQLDAFAAAPPHAPLQRETAAAIDAVAAQVMDERALAAARPRAMTPVTFGLIAINLAAFAAEVWMGGSQDGDTLTSLGALVPSAIEDEGEWWRLLSAAFLHFGPIHLISNMFVLFVLGRLLEPLIGSVRMLVIYLLGAIASSGFVLWLMWSGHSQADLLVGASGAIFTLLGAEVMIVLREWYFARDTFDVRRLRFLGAMLVLQAAIDLSVPQVSFAAHASGFLAGMFALLVWPPRSAGRNRPAATPSVPSVSNSNPGPSS